MADKRSATYDPRRDETYIWNSDGSLATKLGGPVFGQIMKSRELSQEESQRALSSLLEGSMNALGVPSSITKPVMTGGKFDAGQIFKDLLVDTASTAPLAMMPGGSMLKNIGRGAVSMGSGVLTDQLLNDKPLTNSMVDAGINTGLGMAIPGIVEAAQGGASFRIPGKRSIKVSEPTTMERITTSNREGESVRSGSSSSTSNTQSAGSSSSKGSSTTKGKSLSQEVALEGPHTGAINAIKAEISRIEGVRDSRKWNAVENGVIERELAKQRAALLALEEANTSTGFMREFTNTTEGSASGSRSGTSNTARQGTTRGTTGTEGRTETTSRGTSQPGRVTTETSGNTLVERIIEGILDMHRHQGKQMSKTQKMLWGLLPNSLFSTANDTVGK